MASSRVTQVTPAIADGLKLGLAYARVVTDRYLSHRHTEAGVANNHFGGKFHAVGAELHALISHTGEAPQAALTVTEVGLGEETHQPGNDRRADVAMTPGHGAGLDARVAVTDYHFGAVTQGLQEAIEGGEIVGIVAVAHDHVAALTGTDTTAQSAAVTLVFFTYDTGARGGGDAGGGVVRAVVNDDDLTFNPSSLSQSSAFVTQMPTDASSFRQGITIETSTKPVSAIGMLGNLKAGLGIFTVAVRCFARLFMDVMFYPPACFSTKG